jgi:hypothetical protein
MKKKDLFHNSWWMSCLKWGTGMQRTDRNLKIANHHRQESVPGFHRTASSPERQIMDEPKDEPVRRGSSRLPALNASRRAADKSDKKETAA